MTVNNFGSRNLMVIIEKNLVIKDLCGLNIYGEFLYFLGHSCSVYGMATMVYTHKPSHKLDLGGTGVMSRRYPDTG